MDAVRSRSAVSDDCCARPAATGVSLDASDSLRPDGDAAASERNIRSEGCGTSVREYLPILTMIILVLLFASFSFVASKLLGPRRPTSAKEAPYECGIVPEYEPAERFPVKFYLVAMAFIVLDVEIIFLYPFTTIFRGLAAYGLVVDGRLPARAARAVRVPAVDGRARLGPGEAGRRARRAPRSCARRACPAATASTRADAVPPDEAEKAA